MSRVMLACLLAGAVLASATPARRGQGQPAEAPKPTPWAPAASGGEAEAPQAPIDLKTALTPEQYLRAIQPILSNLEQADKALALYDEEMAKPEKERDEKGALGFKERAARFYAAASLRARQSRGYVPQEAQKAAIADQYEIPARDKAIAIYLDLAQIYLSKNDLRAAVAYYQRVLNLDPGNTAATNALKQIEESLKRQAAERNQNPSRTGGGKDEKDHQPIDRNAESWRNRYNRYYSAEAYKNRHSSGSGYGN